MFQIFKINLYFIDDSVFCKIVKSLNKKQIHVILKTIDIKNNIIDDFSTLKLSKN